MRLASLIGALLMLAAAGCGGRPASAPPTAPPNPHMPVPSVVVTRPATGAVVRTTLIVAGTTSVRTVTIELVRGGKVIAERTVQATRRGIFAATLQATPGAVTVEALTTAPQDEVDVPVTVSP